MAQWFGYDWPIEGAQARFAVDMALSDCSCDEWPYLLYLSCESRRRDAPSLNAIESARADGLRKSFVRESPCLYAGYIEVGAQRQFYFYAREKKARKPLDEIAGRERVLACRAGGAEEPEWVTYRQLLYPDAAKMQTERNRDQIALLVKNGDSVKGLRRVSFALFFATESIMLLFAEQARLSGFALAGPVYEPEYELAYGTKIVRLATLDKTEIDALTTRAIRIAEKYGGELRYWDSPVVRRGGPIMEN
ncbi:MAG: hypothetical protein BWY35_01378 [Firmicutes bacterium ADurb.Bin248]|nr:MAG: hypothetical protein BWY35_01378 [Firmicutes bacterium ADurb.Bin248]HOG01713.1 DUF695 domain-containing protein [Clostridia bacterium]HPK15628.1 DUF695 domain-containing protein [Clostridia bacterium]